MCLSRCVQLLRPSRMGQRECWAGWNCFIWAIANGSYGKCSSSLARGLTCEQERKFMAGSSPSARPAGSLRYRIALVSVVVGLGLSALVRAFVVQNPFLFL